jgi:hypothetical protein
LHELDEVVREFGMPPGYANVNEEFDVYIEAQVWDDQPLQGFLQTSREKAAISQRPVHELNRDAFVTPP